MDSNLAWLPLKLNAQNHPLLFISLDDSGRVAALSSESFCFKELKFPLPLSQLSISSIFNGHEKELELRLSLRSLWFTTMGVLEKPYLKKSRKPSELVCRCTGVYLGDIKETLRAEAKTTFDQMIQQLALLQLA